jgi:hypothetical protein
MNTNDKDAWYHCGHCGSLFQSDYGLNEDRVCEICNRNPGIGLWPIVNSVDPVASAKVATFQKTGDSLKKIAITPSRHSRRFKKIIKFTVVWILILLVAVVSRYYITKNTVKPRVLSVAHLNRSLSEQDKEIILNQVFPECDRVIRGYLSATTVDDKGSFIAKSIDYKAVMAMYEKDHPFPDLEVDSLEVTAKEWIRSGKEWMVLSHWRDADGKNEFDAVFRKESDGWKLDWTHFSRFSETSWKLFLVGEGKLDQAEFRLLARQQKDAVAENMRDLRMMIVLAAPEWGKPLQVSDESPMISVHLSSEAGKMLKAAFELREKNLAATGGPLASMDPEGFVRVRVKLTRDEFEGEFRLTINELEACHWMDADISSY